MLIIAFLIPPPTWLSDWKMKIKTHAEQYKQQKVVFL